MTTVFGAVALLALAGCATPGYNASRIENELVRAGATREQARCVTSAFSNEWDARQLASHSSPRSDHDEDEYATTRGILKRCNVTLPLQPPP